MISTLDPAAVLFAAAKVIKTNGHHKADFAPPKRGLDRHAPCCAGGAINIVTGGTPSIAHLDAPPLAGLLAKAALVDHLGLAAEYHIELTEWTAARDEARATGASFGVTEPEEPDHDDLIARWNDARPAHVVVASMVAIAQSLAPVHAQ
jgi:hypothetical protein